MPRYTVLQNVTNWKMSVLKIRTCDMSLRCLPSLVDLGICMYLNQYICPIMWLLIMIKDIVHLS